MIRKLFTTALYCWAATLPFAQNAAAQATLYEGCSFTGYAVSVGLGNTSLSTIVRRGGKNDDISSVIVQPGFEIDL